MCLVHVFREEVNSDDPSKDVQAVFRYLQKLTVSELGEINKAIEDVGFYTVGVNLYYSVQLNMEDLLRSVVEFTDRYMKAGTMDEQQMDMASLSFSRLILNLLGMFKSFVDHGSATLEKKFGAESLLAAEWKRRLSAEYDRSPAYRLFSNLRNYCQHVGMPPLHFSISEAHGIEGVAVTMDFYRDELLANYKRWSKDAKIDLQGGPPTISLLNTLQDWSICFLNLAKWFGDLRRDVALSGAEKIVSLRSTYNIPQGGMLALMEEPQEKDAQDNFNFTVRWISEVKAKNVIDNAPVINTVVSN